MLPSREISISWRNELKGISRSSTKESAQSYTWGGTIPGSMTCWGTPRWKVAVWKMSWVSWWWPKMSMSQQRSLAMRNANGICSCIRQSITSRLRELMLPLYSPTGEAVPVVPGVQCPILDFSICNMVFLPSFSKLALLVLKMQQKWILFSLHWSLLHGVDEAFANISFQWFQRRDWDVELSQFLELQLLVHIAKTKIVILITNLQFENWLCW